MPPTFVLSWKVERKEGGHSELTNPFIPDVEDGETNHLCTDNKMTGTRGES